MGDPFPFLQNHADGDALLRGEVLPDLVLVQLSPQNVVKVQPGHGDPLPSQELACFDPAVTRDELVSLVHHGRMQEPHLLNNNKALQTMLENPLEARLGYNERKFLILSFPGSMRVT
jgi:hypothetical protein